MYLACAVCEHHVQADVQDVLTPTHLRQANALLPWQQSAGHHFFLEHFVWTARE